jgi:flagellar motility protein MotE (MotC chaperone)
MKLVRHLKILPLLVFVSMLSFSVRMADVIHGVTVLSGTAHAETEKPADDKAGAEAKHDAAAAMEKPADDHGTLKFEEEAPAEHAEGAPAGHDAAKPSEEDDIEWRAPIDEDPGYAAIRMEMFEDLAKRRQALDQREKALSAQEALLKAAELELQRKYQELSKLKGEIEGLLTTQSEEEKARIASLVKIYEGMKPKDAARIFDTLDLDILVSVVSQMSERKLSPVLAQMNPERARTITIMLAEQKQLPSLPQSNY